MLASGGRRCSWRAAVDCRRFLIRQHAFLRKRVREGLDRFRILRQLAVPSHLQDGREENRVIGIPEADRQRSALAERRQL